VEQEIERLRKKVENFPSASMYTRLAELLRSAGNATEAETVCRRCIKEFPRSSQAYVILAEMELASQHRAEAIQLLRTAVDKDPRSYAAHRLLADQADSAEAAIGHLRAILAFKPNDPIVTARIAELGGSGQQASATLRPLAASATPLAATATQVVRQVSAPAAAPAPRGAVLDALCAEGGVRGALVADSHGRVVTAKGLDGRDDALAALAGELMRSSTAALATVGASAPAAWTLGCAQGQLLAFSRDRSFTVVVLADSGVRPAMLELRARQALIDLGAA
jgi:predicted regulator of Ras-like GTPase activity (Roadblock/LC7/MglB family)